MLHDSNRPLRLEFYTSLGPEWTAGTDKRLRYVNLSGVLVHLPSCSALSGDLLLAVKLVQPTAGKSRVGCFPSSSLSMRLCLPQACPVASVH